MIGLAFCVLGSCSLAPEQSYPVVTLPPDADTTSPIWKGIDLAPKPPVKALRPEEQQTTFQLPPGYAIEPVLTEPQIEQPAAISFDGAGRMYVLELRSYMLTADADNELEPTSVISRWEDLDNDGVYETGGAFVDSLVFPRFVLPWSPNSVLSMESNQDDVYEYIDEDEDGHAETRRFFTGDYGRSGNVEHQQSFLYYGMDNWLYSTYNPFRIRSTANGVIREPTGYNRGQWGVTQDNYGKIWFQGGASGIPSYFQFPIVYGNFSVDDELAEGFRVPWGAPILLEDLQPGMQAVREPDGSLNQVTGAAGNDVYRGHRLPAAMVGQYFYGEPVARIVRQINPIVTEGITQLHNYYQPYKSEFLKSKDPLFRPVDIATAPDGSLFVVDMYHGIIQEGQWVQKGTYLRTKIEQYQLDKIISLGRIWRITYEGIPRDTVKPRMYDLPVSLMPKQLEHKNGWWRDMAQQEMVRRRDTSIVQQLISMAKDHSDPLTRIHAIWTLEGLESLPLSLITSLLQDANAEVRKTVLRSSEALYKLGYHRLGAMYLEMMEDEHCEVAIQAMQTAMILQVPNYLSTIRNVKESRSERGIQVVAQKIIADSETSSSTLETGDFSPGDLRFVAKGEEIYQGLCATCHGDDGNGITSPGGLLAPPLASSLRITDHPDYLVRVLLHGLKGSIEGQHYTGAIMAPMGSESDEWIAQVSSFVRTHMGNHASLVSPEQVTDIRAQTEGDPVYAYEDLKKICIKHLNPNDQWKVTASHTGLARIGGSGAPEAVFTFEGWTSGESQKAGMWFQIELPRPVNFGGLSFRSPPVWRGREKPAIQTYPRGYKIEISLDGEQWSQPVDSGVCRDANNHFLFPITTGRFLRIVQTTEKTDEAPWKMEKMKIMASYPGVEHG